jgi:hypothetical protein
MTLLMLWVSSGLIAFIFYCIKDILLIVNDIRDGQGGWNWLCLYGIILLGCFAFGPMSFLVFRPEKI